MNQISIMCLSAKRWARISQELSPDPISIDRGRERRSWWDALYGFLRNEGEEALRIGKWKKWEEAFAQEKNETVLEKDSDWKARYSELYSSHRVFRTQGEEPRRISFMSNVSTPRHASLLSRLRALNRDSQISGYYDMDAGMSTTTDINTVMSQRSEIYDSYANSQGYEDLTRNDTLLLDMVRARSREIEEEAQDKTLDLPMTRDDNSDDQSSEACVHGLSMRMTDHSVSRSRVSRISTRRDMDIPSILAFHIPITPAPAPLLIPGLRKVTPKNEDIPLWSIRRSVCPVCSQKWRDKSSIQNVKYSGLKRNSSAELPSVMAPARLRASITVAYTPRPFLAAVDESTEIGRPMRNSSAAWLLTRARRFRIPKLQMPSPEAIAPLSSTAPLARKDLDIRVNRFLNDEKNSKELTTVSLKDEKITKEATPKISISSKLG